MSTSASLIYRAPYYALFYKPPTWSVLPDKTDDTRFTAAIELELGPTAQPVHRIDKPVSGIVLVAKGTRATAFYQNQLAAEDTHKVYYAITEAAPTQHHGVLEHYLTHDRRKRKALVSDTPVKQSKHARLTYEHVAASDRYHLIKVELATGRFHQIRAQLAAIGCPIKGDVKYGARRSNRDRSIHLHAYALTFTDEDGEKQTHTAPLPDDTLWQYFQPQIMTTDLDG